MYVSMYVPIYWNVFTGCHSTHPGTMAPARASFLDSGVPWPNEHREPALWAWNRRGRWVWWIVQVVLSNMCFFLVRLSDNPVQFWSVVAFAAASLEDGLGRTPMPKPVVSLARQPGMPRFWCLNWNNHQHSFNMLVGLVAHPIWNDFDDCSDGFLIQSRNL